MVSYLDVVNTPATGYNYIDALLAGGPDWNFVTDDGSNFRTTLYYSFDTAGAQYETHGLQAFNSTQQQAAREILAYIAQITGISFAETSSAAATDIHFAAADIADPSLGGVTYASYTYNAKITGQLTQYSADAYVYLDTLLPANQSPVAGTWGYQALLHEIGHALGLKHPFEATQDAPTTLAPPYSDTTSQTVMSYTDAASAYYSQFNEYDLAALNYLYGADGLGGVWGVGTAGTYLSGSSFDSVMSLPAGQVNLVDMGGTETVLYDGAQKNYTIAPTFDKLWLQVSGGGANHLISSSVEYLAFADGTVETKALLNPDPGVDPDANPDPGVDPDTNPDPGVDPDTNPDPGVDPDADTVRYGGEQKDYTFVPTRDKLWLHVSGPDTDQLLSTGSVKYLAFADGTTMATTALLDPKGSLVRGADTADFLIGTAGADLLFGGSGNDTLFGGGGDDLLLGSDGLDTAQFAEQMSNATISRFENMWVFNDRYSQSSLSSIERLQFLDGTLALDLGSDESAGMAALLASAAKGEGSLADRGFMGELISFFDSGMDMHQISSVITGADWFKAATGGTDVGFVNLVYEHVVGFTPSTAEQNIYLGMLAGHGGSMSQADLLVVAALTPVNQDAIDLVGLQQTGLAYI